ncbi:LOW QUALITY PROTEIN: DNA nucleotidylexotransferase [Phycodurus eques]|uniref:LOW QUALITY PROTEIN: DNA nucleotidylexotransferase n=1 Tax=Phycodurus eques TaxID=693459 RepID=UPI002ACE5970|nr:LOW QUALITY PROTEIN: DNA nucleotidylexotransferase [Phycodurus eques]
MFHAGILPRVRKRSKPASVGVPRHAVKFKELRLFLVERKMGCSRRSFLAQLARSKGFIVDDILSDDITHVVSEDSEAASLWEWLKGCGLKNLSKMQVLHISWFTDSMRVGRPAAVENRHLIQDTLPASQEASVLTPVATISQYACQRRTSTDNKNKILTDALEVLAENYEFSEIKSSCLAFRRAASVLKSLPWTVQCIGATQSLPCLREHTKAVMEEILQCGHAFEVERALSSERYQTLKLFTSVFGVGPKTAEKWYRRGLRSFCDILAEPSIQLNRMQQSGFLHYGDITRVVTKAEAQALGNIIDEAVHLITSDAVIALTGGFRRGKEVGHDVDFIVTTHEVGKEECVLRNIIDTFKKQGILLYCDYQASTFHVSKLPCQRFEAMDYFAKCFLILRLEASHVDGGLNCAEGDKRGWRAVRVDLVSPPMDRYAYALLGWTGSTQFDRDLRRFARLERKMILDNHTLYDKTKGEFLTARSEEDIFAHLGLEYIEPWQRNA